MSERVRVADADALSPGDRKLVTVDDREIGVINHEGELYAVSNVCPHQGGEVARGEILPEVTVEAPERGRRPETVYADRLVIACPWHGWEYDVETGVHCGSGDVTLPTYDVVVEDGGVYLEL